jgi:hypothetical protein
MQVTIFPFGAASTLNRFVSPLNAIILGDTSHVLEHQTCAMYSAWSGHRCFIIFLSSTLGIKYSTPWLFPQIFCLSAMVHGGDVFQLMYHVGCCAVQGVVKSGDSKVQQLEIADVQASCCMCSGGGLQLYIADVPPWHMQLQFLSTSEFSCPSHPCLGLRGCSFCPSEMDLFTSLYLPAHIQLQIKVHLE